MTQSFKTAFKYIRRSHFLTLSAVFSMTISLFLTLAFTASFWLTHLMLKSLEARAQLTVFFKTETPESTILARRDELRVRGGIESVGYISQEEALKIYLGQHQNDPTLLESVSKEILPASLEIKAGEIAALESLSGELKNHPEVDEVIYFKDVVRNFSRGAVALRILGATLSILVLAVSLLVVSLSVGVAVKVRADEIEIKRLLGATDGQVAGPFILQGMLYGLASAALSLLLFAFVLALSFSQLQAIFLSLRFGAAVFWLGLVGLALGHLLAGPLLCGLASAVGLRKYLRL